jgi:hypothetical protein
MSVRRRRKNESISALGFELGYRSETSKLILFPVR